MPIVNTMPAMPGKSQRGAEQHEAGEDEADMHGKRDIGENAERPIGDRACRQNTSPAADIGREFAGVDRILAEALDRPFAPLRSRAWAGKRAGPQQDRQIGWPARP